MVFLNEQSLRTGRAPSARNRGITRVTAVILVLTAAALVLTAIPAVLRWREENAAFNCTLSVAKMQDLLDTEVLFRQRALTPKETLEFLEKYKEMGEILCPDGGEFDAVERNSMSMEVVCCRHDTDGKRRVRLCGARVLERVRNAVWLAQLNGDPFPDQVKITLNSRPLIAKRVDQATLLRRGTSTVKGHKGVVAYYAVAGQGDGDGAPAVSSEKTSSETGSSETASSEAEGSETISPAETDAALSDTAPGSDTLFLPDGEAEEGEVWYLSYADEEHAATWTVGDGWRIDGIRLRK